MPMWFPKGAAGIDHFVFPVLLFPLVWALALLYAVLEDDFIRSSSIMTSLIVLNSLVAWSSGGWITTGSG